VLYKATDYYAPEWERSILWNDPTINISWPLIDGLLILSTKDQMGKLLLDAEIFE
jgi:dTDP-4-dehydrorhamnose 3,5-epimerase